MKGWWWKKVEDGWCTMLGIGDIAFAVLYKMFLIKWDILRLLIYRNYDFNTCLYIYLDVSIYFFYCVLLFGFAPGILRSCLWHDRTFSKVIYIPPKYPKITKSGHVTLQSYSCIFQHQNLGFFPGISQEIMMVSSQLMSSLRPAVIQKYELHCNGPFQMPNWRTWKKP